MGCGFGVGWGFGGAPLGFLGTSIGGGCGVGVGLGFGAGAGFGSWYIPANSAFEEKRQPGERLVNLVKKLLSPSK